MILDKTQLDFLNSEFKLTKSDLANIPKDKWHEIREKCADIEISETIIDEPDETLTEEDDAYYDCVHCTERGEIAASIVNITYKALFS